MECVWSVPVCVECARVYELSELKFKFHEKFRYNMVYNCFLLGSKVTVVLHTSISDDKYFKLSKLAPGHNNVRRYYLSQLPNQSDESQNPSDGFQNSSDGPPTPHYNASLLSELGSRERHLITLYSALHDSPGVTDAVLLCKVWARQRGLDKVRLSLSLSLIIIIVAVVLPLQVLCSSYASGYRVCCVCFVQGVGGLTGFHFSMLAAWLCTQRKVNAHMSSYQAFRVILQNFVTSDWATNGIAMAQVHIIIILYMFLEIIAIFNSLRCFVEK